MFVQLEDISHNEGSLQGQHYNTRRSYITKPQLHQPALFPCSTSHLSFLHILSQQKCCSHLLQKYHGVDLGLCLLSYLAIKHTPLHLQKENFILVL